LEHYRRTYVPRELVVTAAGSVDHDALCTQVVDAVRAGGWTLDPAAVPAARRHGAAAARARGIDVPGSGAVVVPGPESALLLTTVLGGGMSSRLFQEIREKRGLAYSTYAFASSYAEAGTFGLYAGCAPGNVERVTELLVSEWDRLAADGITADELVRGVGQLR